MLIVANHFDIVQHREVAVGNLNNQVVKTSFVEGENHITNIVMRTRWFDLPSIESIRDKENVPAKWKWAWMDKPYGLIVSIESEAMSVGLLWEYNLFTAFTYRQYILSFWLCENHVEDHSSAKLTERILQICAKRDDKFGAFSRMCEEYNELYKREENFTFLGDWIPD